MSLISLDNVSFGYSRKQQVLHDVSFSLRSGVNVGLVGESGSGKSTILKLLLGLARPTGGRIQFGDAELNPRDRAFMRDYRKAVQAVFQDPYSSLDPRQRIGKIVREPLRHVKATTNEEKDQRVAEVMKDVGLAGMELRFPHELSGGQRQRIAIARAIVRRPAFVVADEPVSALDMTIQAQVLSLFKTLQGRYGFACLFISHDLSAVRSIAHRVLVMEKGRMVETGQTAHVLSDPKHPYTRRLVDAAPLIDSS